LRPPETLNVPSVVVESSSNEKTMPERPAPRVEPKRGEPLPIELARTEPPMQGRGEPSRAEPARVEARAATPTSSPPPEGRRQGRRPTGEWFSAGARGVTDATGYDDDFDDLPRKNRAPLIIGGVVGGLGLAVVVVIALLPKPQHKPLRGEEA